MTPTSFSMTDSWLYRSVPASISQHISQI